MARKKETWDERSARLDYEAATKGLWLWAIPPCVVLVAIFVLAMLSIR